MLNRHMNITASERGKIRHVLSMVSLQNSGRNITSVRQRPRHAKPSTLNLRISFTAFPFRSSEKEVFLSRSAVFQMSSEHGCTRECINFNFPVHDQDVAQEITPILGSSSDFISDSTSQYVSPRIPGYKPFHRPLRRLVCENRCSSLAGRSHPVIPRQIRRTNKLRQCFVKEAPAGYS